jgi:hypothetical protein
MTIKTLKDSRHSFIQVVVLFYPLNSSSAEGLCSPHNTISAYHTLKNKHILCFEHPGAMA